MKNVSFATTLIVLEIASRSLKMLAQIQHSQGFQEEISVLIILDNPLNIPRKVVILDVNTIFNIDNN